MRSILYLFYFAAFIFSTLTFAAELSQPQVLESKQKLKKTLWTATINRSLNLKNSIEGFKLISNKIPISLVGKDSKLRPIVEIRAQFNHPGWILKYQNNSPVYIDPKTSEIIIFAYLNGKVNELTLKAVSSTGHVESEQLIILAPEAQEFQVVSPWNAVKLYTGSSYFSFGQTGFGSFTAISGDLGIEYKYPYKETHFGILANLNLTALTFTSTSSIHSPQIINGHFDVSYDLNFFPPNYSNTMWKTQIIFGGFYSSMFSNGSNFGFSNLIGGEGGLLIQFVKSPQSTIDFSFRLTPLSTTLSERSYEFITSYSWLLTSLHRCELGIAYTDLNYKPQSDTNIQLSSLLLLIGYSL